MRIMLRMAPMQKPVDRMVMIASRRPITPELQLVHGHSALVALQPCAGWGGGGRESARGRSIKPRAARRSRVGRGREGSPPARAASTARTTRAPG